MSGPAKKCIDCASNPAPAAYHVLQPLQLRVLCRPCALSREARGTPVCGKDKWYKVEKDLRGRIPDERERKRKACELLMIEYLRDHPYGKRVERRTKQQRNDTSSGQQQQRRFIEQEMTMNDLRRKLVQQQQQNEKLKQLLDQQNKTNTELQQQLLRQQQSPPVESAPTAVAQQLLLMRSEAIPQQRDQQTHENEQLPAQLGHERSLPMEISHSSADERSVQHHIIAEKECRQLFRYFQQIWKPGKQMYVNGNFYPGFSRYNNTPAGAAVRVRHQKFHTVLLTSEDDTTAETPGLYTRFKEDLPPRASKNWEILEREVLKIATTRRGDCHSDSVHSYSDLDGSYAGSAISFLSGNWHRSCEATDGNTLKVTFFCTRDKILCGHFLKQNSKAVAHFRWHIDNDRQEDENGNVYSNEGHWDAVVTVVVVLGSEGTPSGIAFKATQPQPDPAEEELERLERSDPGDMDITQLQALYEYLIGRPATDALGKDESGLRLEIAEAHRKHLLFCCYPNFADKCVDVALKTEGAKGVEIKENGVAIALATVVENRLLCICVRDDFQKSRYGTFLLSECCTLIHGDEMVVEADLVFEEWYRQRGFERAGSKATETCVLMRASKSALLNTCNELTKRRRRPWMERF